MEVPNQFFFEWIQSHYKKSIQKQTEEAFGDTINIKYTVSPENNESEKEKNQSRGKAYSDTPKQKGHDCTRSSFIYKTKSHDCTKGPLFDQEKQNLKNHDCTKSSSIYQQKKGHDCTKSSFIDKKKVMIARKVHSLTKKQNKSHDCTKSSLFDQNKKTKKHVCTKSSFIDKKRRQKKHDCTRSSFTVKTKS